MDNNTENFTNAGTQGGAGDPGNNVNPGNAGAPNPYLNAINAENTGMPQNAGNTGMPLNTENAGMSMNTENPDASADTGAPINISSAFVNNGYSVNSDPGYTQGFVPPANGGADTKGPKKKAPIVAIIVAVVAVLAVGIGVFAIFFRAVLANSWARMTKSPEEYTKYVLEKNLIDNDALWKGYEEAYAQAGKLDGMKISGETRLELSKDMVSLIEDGVTEAMNSSYYFGGYQYYDEYREYMNDEWDKGNYDYLDYDEWEALYKPANGDTEPLVHLDAWSDIALHYEFERTDKEARAMQALQLSDRDYMLTFNELYNSDKSELYLQIPEINKDYMKISLEDFLDEDELDSLNEVLFDSNAITEQMIDPKTAKSIYTRYMNILISKINNVDEKDEKFEIAGAEQKCVALKFALDEDLIKETGTELLESLMDDSELREMFRDYVEASPMATMGGSFDDIWDEYTTSLEEAMQELEDAEFTTEPVCTLYVNNVGQIIGFSIENDENSTAVRCGYVLDKTQIKMGLYCTKEGEDVYTFEGDGKLTTSGITADFTCYSAEADKEFTFRVENLTAKGGAFSIDLDQFYKMAEDELDELDGDAADAVDMFKKGTLRIEYHSETKQTEMSIAIMDGNDKLICISNKLSIDSAGKIEMPSSKETENIQDEMDLLQYATESDLGVLVDKLEELGLPEDTADELRSGVEMLNYY